MCRNLAQKGKLSLHRSDRLASLGDVVLANSPKPAGGGFEMGDFQRIDSHNARGSGVNGRRFLLHDPCTGDADRSNISVQLQQEGFSAFYQNLAGRYDRGDA